MKLEIHNLSKKYNKEKYGLRNFSLTIENGILGLLGPNGAGKTTLMKIIATISQPTEGSITLDGVDITKEPNAISKILGYLPDDFGVLLLSLVRLVPINTPVTAFFNNPLPENSPISLFSYFP